MLANYFDLPSFLFHSFFFKKVTPSQLFFAICIAFIIGVALANFINFSLIIIYAAAWFFLILGIISWFRSPALSIVAFFILALLAGFIRVSITKSDTGDFLASFVDQKVELVGYVLSAPIAQTRSVRFQFSLEGLNSTSVSSDETKIEIVARQFPEVVLGDKLIVRGKISAGERGQYKCAFPDITILSDLPVGGVSRALSQIKNVFVSRLQKIFPEPAGGFIVGLLAGGSSALGASERVALTATGTSHLVALSGFNVTIIANFILSILSWVALPRHWRPFFVGVILTIFIIMVGGGSSLIRAAIMGMLVVIARQSGRISSARNSIALAAVIMLAIDPGLIAFDLSWQLSFLATLGLIYLFPIFERLAARLPEFLKLKESLLMAVAAEIFVVPLLIYHFGRLSLISPLVNMLVVPPIAGIMFFGFLGGLVGFISVTLGQIIGAAGWLGATYVLKIIELASSLPMASLILFMPAWFLVIYYIVLSFGLFKISHIRI